MLYMRGLVRGVTTEHRGKNQEYTFHYLVLETLGYEIHKLQLPDVLSGDEMRKKFAALENKEVDAEVSLRTYVTKGGTAVVSYQYNGGELPKIHLAKAA